MSWIRIAGCLQLSFIPGLSRLGLWRGQIESVRISLPVNARYQDAFAAIDRDPNQFLAVVELDSSIAGCLQLSFIPGLSRLGLWRGQIESVRIAAGLRGAGLGRAMFEWAIAQCRERGCGLVQLTTDRARRTRAGSTSLGFAASHDGMKLNLEH